MILLLMVFEMEMMFMYPWAVVCVEEGAKALVEMGMFLAILSVGIFYGWRKGFFRWEQPRKPASDLGNRTDALRRFYSVIWGSLGHWYR